MNWEAIGAVGEILGALAVVVSLVYLASQIRVQNRESRVASVHEILEGFRTLMTVHQDHDRAAVWLTGIAGLENLSDVQRVQFFAITQHSMRLTEEAYFQRQAGRLDERLWTAFDAQNKDILTTKGVQEVWALRKHVFSNEFRDFIDSVEGGNYEFSRS